MGAGCRRVLQTVSARPGRVPVPRTLGFPKNVALVPGPGDLTQGLEEGCLLAGGGGQAPSLGASCLGEPGEGESRGEESKRQGERQGPATSRPCDLTQFSALLGR